MKRLLDIVLSVTGLTVLALPIVVAVTAILLSSPGPALHWSRRVGRNNVPFLMPKFRTMRVDTPQLPTHLMKDAAQWVTPIGHWLRRTSFDEVPQLWSVLIGKMSMVGPRPALFNQDDLVEMRTQSGVHRLLPGVTGLAQINGRDELPIAVKAGYDAEYRERMSLSLDLQIIGRTVLNAFKGDGISH